MLKLDLAGASALARAPRPVATSLAELSPVGRLFIIAEREEHQRFRSSEALLASRPYDSWSYFLPVAELPLLREGLERNLFGTTHEKRDNEWFLLAWRRSTDAISALAAKPLNAWSRQLEELLLAPH